MENRLDAGARFCGRRLKRLVISNRKSYDPNGRSKFTEPCPW